MFQVEFHAGLSCASLSLRESKSQVPAQLLKGEDIEVK